MANMFARGIHATWLASLRRPTNRFIAAMREPEKVQGRKLVQLLVRHADTAYGRAHGFQRIGTVSDWQDRVPVVDYAALSPWVDRVAAGEAAVLTRDPVLMFESTAGTTGPAKMLPYTKGLLDELMAATGPWLFEVYRQWPKIVGTRSYWSTPRPPDTGTPATGEIPVGAGTDTPYFGPIEGWAHARVVAGGVSDPSQAIEPLDTARELLEADDLGFISVWAPSDLTDLVSLIKANFEALLVDLPDARSTNLRGAVNAAGAVTVEALWPALALVSCWADAPSTEALRTLRTVMPTTPIQAKGLLATEGVVTVPIGASEGAVAAVASHFLEFRDVQTPSARPRLAHEVQEGARYRPILTTSGGLYRYQLRDVIRCIGHAAAAPRFVVEGRAGTT